MDVIQPTETVERPASGTMTGLIAGTKGEDPDICLAIFSTMDRADSGQGAHHLQGKLFVLYTILSLSHRSTLGFDVFMRAKTQWNYSTAKGARRRHAASNCTCACAAPRHPEGTRCVWSWQEQESCCLRLQDRFLGESRGCSNLSVERSVVHPRRLVRFSCRT